MRLLRFGVLVCLLGIVGWLVVRSVSVESNGERVQITIDRQKLKAAGHDLEKKGRQAAGKVGQALQVAGKKLDDGDDQRDRRD